MPQTVFSNVMIFDGSGKKPFAGEVLVQGNRIGRVARGAGKIKANGAKRVDGGGATLMPGLVNCHGHASYADAESLTVIGDWPPEEHTLKTMHAVKTMLDSGFTAVVSAASAKPRLDIVIRNEIAAGRIPGPRMLAATPEITVTGGLGDVDQMHMHHETFAIIADGADEIRKTCRTYVREGVDSLKINNSGDHFVRTN